MLNALIYLSLARSPPSRYLFVFVAVLSAYYDILLVCFSIKLLVLILLFIE